MVYLRHLSRDPAATAGIISATRGNHGQSLAFAARRHQIPTTIVVPRGNSREKNAAMQALGADLIEYGEDFTDASEHAKRLAAERGMLQIPSFHPLLVRGVASYWLELFRAVPDLDTVYVPVGLGSGICAGLAVRQALGLKTKLVGVVSSRAPAYALSFAAGKSISHSVTPTIADGVAVRRPDPDALDLITRGVDRILQVCDEEVETAMRAYFIDTHNAVEGAGAVPLAALLQEGERMRGKKIGLILTGGNVDHDVFARVLGEGNHEPRRGVE